MKIYKVILSFCFVLIQYHSFSQQCGTVASPVDIERVKALRQKGIEKERQFIQNYHVGKRSSTTLYVPVKAHIVRPSNGVGGLTVEELDEAIDTMNYFYANVGMEFFICDGINYIDSDTHYDFNNSNDASFTSTHNVANLINIYFCNKWN